MRTAGKVYIFLLGGFSANTLITGGCTCEKTVDGGLLPGEVDFTTRA